MKAQTGKRLAWSLWGLAVTVVVLSFIAALLGLLPTEEDAFFRVIALLMILGYATVGALIASRHRRNPIGWIFLSLALGMEIGILGEEYAIQALQAEPTPSSTAVFAAWLGGWFLVPVIAAIPVVFVLFPTGRVPSRRWRALVWVIVAAAAVAVTGLIIQPRALSPQPGISIPNPTGVESLRGIAGIIVGAGGWPMLGAALLSVTAPFFRYRRAGTEERQQIRWLAYVALAAGVLLAGTFVTGVTLEGSTSWINDILFTLTVVSIAVGIPVASGFAILKYRLFDLDVVVRKTVVFGILAAFITVAYFVVAVGIPTLFFGTAGAINLVPFIAAAALALLFQPLRHWAGRLANRLVYGKRATPYEILSELSQRMGSAYADEEVLARIARVLGEGTGAARAEVWLRVGGELRPAASWPTTNAAQPSMPLVGDDVPALPGADRTFSVRHQGELLGALTVEMPRGESPTPVLDKLLGDVASQAGLVLRNVRLIEELRASRQRLVAAQDEERRRLERNIHDGAQQQLVALAVKLRLLGSVAEQDGAKAKELADQLRGETQDALENLRDLARGIYPPLLADKGLASALESQARKGTVPVALESNGMGRYPAEVEATVYFCVLEALQNVAKYADATGAVIRLGEENGRLVFRVSDDGRGFDPSSTPKGSGLQNMADRIDALGGQLEIRSTVGQGTTLEGRILFHASEGRG
ncbi:MAG: histidine kinase [Actinomycetota bacterium]